MHGSAPIPENNSRRITKEAINSLPMIAWEGPVTLLNTKEAMEEAIEKLIKESHVGFDTETRPSFRRGEYHLPALVQIATADCVYLFRICMIKTLKPLLPLLETPETIKTGVAINDDVKELQKMDDFKPAGFVEITDLTKKLGYENRGLRALAGLLMGGRISKAAQVSNWARSKLDEKQLRYAATDAWISREIYRRAQAEEPI